MFLFGRAFAPFLTGSALLFLLLGMPAGANGHPEPENQTPISSEEPPEPASPTPAASTSGTREPSAPSTSMYAHPRLHFDRPAPPAGPPQPGVLNRPAEAAEPRRSNADHPLLGLGLWGARQIRADEPTLHGLVGGLQLRTSRLTLLGFELQALGDDFEQRRLRELGGLVTGRFFLWDWFLSPYLVLGGGLARSTFETAGSGVKVLHAVGTAGLGIELRLGDNIVLDGQVSQIHRLKLSASGWSGGRIGQMPVGDSGDELVHPWGEAADRGWDLRAGLTVRF